MSIITRKSTLEADLYDKENRVKQCAEATHHLAVTLRNAYYWLWGLPTDRLLAILNHDVAVTLETFAANSALGTVVNASLDAAELSEFSTRAPVVPGRKDIIFDGKKFGIAPPEPAPTTPDPAPEQESSHGS